MLVRSFSMRKYMKFTFDVCQHQCFVFSVFDYNMNPLSKKIDRGYSHTKLI